jgi:hypothetical protein
MQTPINLALLLYAAGIWFVCGYGFVRAMLPRRSWGEASLLAPLAGLCLLGFAGLLELGVLYVPLYPLANVVGLASGSLVLALWAGRRPAVGVSGRELLLLLAVPLVVLVCFASLFRREGFHLLVGSQDQIQYCDNARHMLYVMHTDSPLDVPVARQDHYLADSNTRVLPYLKRYRRGAEINLATLMALTGCSAEAAFPLTVGASLLTLGLTLAFLGRCCLRLRWGACVVLQFVFLTSYHLILLHYQGSLAHLLGVPILLAVVGLAPRAFRSGAPGRLALTGLMAGSVLSFYSEPALVGLIVPFALLAGWRLWKDRRRARLALRFACLVVLIGSVSPTGVFSLVKNTTTNLQVLGQQLQAPGVAAQTGEQADPLSAFLQSPLWANMHVLLGVSSYYDQSPVNHALASYARSRPWLGLLVPVVLWAVALLGLLRRRSAVARLFALILLAWVGSCVLFAHAGDFLRCCRSSQYALPYALVGIVVLSFGNSFGSKRSLRCLVPALGWSARAVLLVFVVANTWTAIRTFRYTVGHNASNDGIVFRVQPDRREWITLREQLCDSCDAPVLLAGYRDTIRPHLLANGIQPARHFVGASILSFWPLMSTTEKPASQPYSDLNTRLTEAQYHDHIARENQMWGNVVPGFLESSVQALVPRGHGYPTEWTRWSDVFPPRILTGHPYCDVVYKTEHAIELSPVGERSCDERGPYRLLGERGFLSFQDTPAFVRLTLRHEGNVGDVELVADGVETTEVVLSPRGEVALAAIVDITKPIEVRRVSDREVKLRSLSWRAVPGRR